MEQSKINQMSTRGGVYFKINFPIKQRQEAKILFFLLPKIKNTRQKNFLLKSERR